MNHFSYFDPFFRKTHSDTNNNIEQQQIDETNPFTYPENLENALELIRLAVQEEDRDSLYNNFLIDNAVSSVSREILEEIRDDEIRHYQLLKQIYFDLTGEEVPEPELIAEYEQPSCFCEGLKTAILGDSKNIELYRQILYAMESRVHINMVTDMLTDEIKHVGLYNYIYSKNGCRI